MSWKPPERERPPRDERVEACRDRGALLRHADGRLAVLYCRVDTEWTCTGGHLWWRSWSAAQYRLDVLWFEGGDLVSDVVAVGEDLVAVLDDFDRGVFVVAGEEWRVQWMGEDGSRSFRREHDVEEHRR